MGDVFSTVGAVIAGVIIYFTNANWLDPLVSMLIGFLILYNAWGILRDTMDILLEATPRDIDTTKLVYDVLQVEGVLGVHDLHVWSLTKLCAHVRHILTDDLQQRGHGIQRGINEIVFTATNLSRHAQLNVWMPARSLSVTECHSHADHADKEHALPSRQLIPFK